MRAAARPTAAPLTAEPGVAGSAAIGADDLSSAPPSDPVAGLAAPDDEMPPFSPAWIDEPDESAGEQLSAFDSHSPGTSEPGPPAVDDSPAVSGPAAADPEEPRAPAPDYSGWADSAQVSEEAPLRAAEERETPGPPPDDATRDAEPAFDAGAAPVPEFLSGRSPRAAPPAAPVPATMAPTLAARSSGEGAAAQKVKREDLVPSWEIDGRYGAQTGEKPPDDRFGGLLTLLAVVAILALGVAGVIFLPGLLAGGSPTRTPAPSFVLPSADPSVQPSAVTPAPSLAPTDAPTIAPATPTASPLASPVSYRIKAGDNLRKIARRFDTTVEEILAVNPQIQDANHIQVGQVIDIPPPSQ